MLLALVGEGRKFSMIYPGVDRFAALACYRPQHLRFDVLKRDRYARELPMVSRFSIWPTLVERDAVGALTYSLFQIVGVSCHAAIT
jgi:hypothetical protein